MNKEQLSARVQEVYDATDFDDPNGNFSSYYYAGYIGAEGWMEIVNQLIGAGVIVPVDKEKIEETDRCARAYGWEIGRGHPLTEKLETSPDNPFLNPNWREEL